MSIELDFSGNDGVGRMRFVIVRQRDRGPRRKLCSGTVVGDEVHVAWWRSLPLFPHEMKSLGDKLATVAEYAKNATGRRPDPRGQNGGGTPGAGGLPGDEGGPPADSTAEGAMPPAEASARLECPTNVTVPGARPSQGFNREEM